MTESDRERLVRFRNKTSAAATVLAMILLVAVTTVFSYFLLGPTALEAATVFILIVIAGTSIRLIINDWKAQQAQSKETVPAPIRVAE